MKNRTTTQSKENVILNTDIQINLITAINNISSVDWHNLNTASCPFLKYDFFNALENSCSVSAKQGWQPHHLVAKHENDITAIIPMYLKNHSWGEYVFDWDWAEAFKRNGIDYYPKLVATIPFTPVTSEKILSSTHDITDFFTPLIDHCEHKNINSWHILYCPKIKADLPEDVYERNTVQFHWFNREYKKFDDFLNLFTSRKRKNTRKERLSITEQGLKIRQLKHNDITPKDIDFFYLTYQLTYLKKGHQPHLSPEFFQEMLMNMAENILLIIASKGEEDIACALFFYDDSQLYGRYWGCTKQYNNLHFELCYYQGIEFCIQNNIKTFNPGTQGEHKIQRGFEPVLTHSYHWIKHPAFKHPVKNFCKQEQQHMLTYQQQCQARLPFRE
ncbi:GNAT family N-acetyltransferase [Algibacillus agarilyticus]|uniref:GNAT family N-acetyltransferase n=1 Tax=Algibacillus agarilyticus TaxID=2234133 RepID=UPI001E3167AF|nr:GNAT family N-acetyltransferase [Algibacillus agarilyticus]